MNTLSTQQLISKTKYDQIIARFLIFEISILTVCLFSFSFFSKGRKSLTIVVLLPQLSNWKRCRKEIVGFCWLAKHCFSTGWVWRVPLNSVKGKLRFWIHLNSFKFHSKKCFKVKQKGVAEIMFRLRTVKFVWVSWI